MILDLEVFFAFCLYLSLNPTNLALKRTYSSVLDTWVAFNVIDGFYWLITSIQVH